MRLVISTILCAIAVPVLSAIDTELVQVRNVYLMPMRGGLDQFIANQITRGGVFQVVADPNLADAIFTDHLGAGFEQALAELYPPPKPVLEEKKKEDEDKQDKEKTDDNKAAEPAANWESAGTRISTFSRGRGNVFLVERGSLRVLWSFYKLARSTRPEELDRTAGDIVERLGKDIKQIKTSAPVPPPPGASAPAAPTPPAPAAETVLKNPKP
jgi:hypothetical protein